MGLKRQFIVLALSLHIFIQTSTADRLAYQVYRRQEPTFPVTVQPALVSDDQIIATPIVGNDGSNVPLSSLSAAAASPTSEMPTSLSATASATSEMSTSLSAAASATSEMSTSLSAAASATSGMSTSLPNISDSSYKLMSSNLPITPLITPGYAIAGVFLVMTGAVYATIGIRNKWLQTYLSSAYLASIATTVLILYVMSLPVTKSTQGAYIVAVVVAGAVLGAVSIVFMEITEGLGCLLGGFCFSMWLLALKPGGLLSGIGKPILIGAIAAGSFATFYNNYTKHYSLIAFISFGGATSLILGIDCFSRAGLKEFWAYIWALNSNLFPPDTVSYPLTRGMKVEIASILVISMMGIISQIKLWKVVQQRHQSKLAERQQNARQIEEEEENIGKRIQEDNAKAINQWEVMYGDNDKDVSVSNVAGETDLNDLADTETAITSILTPVSNSRNIENEITSKNIKSEGIDDGVNDSCITVRIAQDTDEPEKFAQIDMNEKTPQTDSDHEAIPENCSPHRCSKNTKGITTSTHSTAPVVVPLPFKIPKYEKSISDIPSSAGTCGSMDDTWNDSTELPENIPADSKTSREFSKLSRSSSRLKNAPYVEDLNANQTIISPRNSEDDGQSSVAAATLGDHLTSADDAMTTCSNEKYDIPIPNVSNSVVRTDISNEATPNSFSQNNSPTENPSQLKKDSLEPVTSNDDNLETQFDSKEIPEEPTSPTSSKSKKGKNSGLSSPLSKKASQELDQCTSSSHSNLQSTRSRITKDSLPSQFSKVFASYRTNEWAKHLGHAETPEVGELTLLEYSDETEPEIAEKPAPVMVQELQQSSEIPQSPVMQNVLMRHSSHSGIHRKYVDISHEFTHTSIHPDPITKRNSSGNLIHGNTSPHMTFTKYKVESPRNSKFMPADQLVQAHLNGARAYGTTLIGMRDSIIKNKNFNNNSSSNFTQEAGVANTLRSDSSETGSVYNHLLTEEGDNIPLSHRRSLLRHSSLLAAGYKTTKTGRVSPAPKFDSHQPRRNSTGPSSQARENQLASWRASLYQDLCNASPTHERIDHQRTLLHESHKQEMMRRLVEERKKGAMEEAWNQKMRSGEMLDAHREALRRLQQKANQNFI